MNESHNEIKVKYDISKVALVSFNAKLHPHH